ncbi:unnamed protein product, partial [Mesorhabditis spiculigera]
MSTQVLYNVESIEGRRGNGSKRRYRVKWEGYDEPTMEPVRCFPDGWAKTAIRMYDEAVAKGYKRVSVKGDPHELYIGQKQVNPATLMPKIVKSKKDLAQKGSEPRKMKRSLGTRKNNNSTKPKKATATGTAKPKKPTVPKKSAAPVRPAKPKTAVSAKSKKSAAPVRTTVSRKAAATTAPQATGTKRKTAADSSRRSSKPRFAWLVFL